MVDPLDIAALEASARAGGLGDLLAAWEPRMDALRGSFDEDRAWWAVLRAIRLDLPLIVDRPQQLFQCVADRLWMAESTPAFVAALLARWRQERARRGEGAWARPLRPPQFPLDAPILEEYRGRFDRFDGLALTGSTVTVGEGESRFAWDRRTGRRLPHAPSDEAGRLTTPREGDSGRDRTIGPDRTRVRLVDAKTGAAAVDTVLSLDGRLDAGVRGSDGAVFAYGWEGEYEGVVVRLDPPYREPTWIFRTPNMVRSVSVVGDRVAVAGHTLTLADARTGLPIWVNAVRCDRAALSPDAATVATLSPGVVRLWRADTQPPPPAYPRTRTADVLEFSPDGRRLMTGTLLCDGQDGRILATLPLDSGEGYLEGGPPPGGHRLSDRRFVQFGAMPGVRAWDSEDGRLLWQAPRRAMGIRSIEVSPDANMALVVRRAKAALVRVDDGTPVLGNALPEFDLVRFSARGPLLGVTDSGALHILDGQTGLGLVARDPGDGPLTDAVFSWDGKLLVTAGQDGTLRQFATSDLRLLGTRTMDPDFRLDTANGLRALEGWGDFTSAPHPWRGRRAGPWFEILDTRDGRVVAAIPSEDDLIADPAGTRWAGPDVHIALEFDAP